MADNTTIHIGENSPEEVAYKLLRDVAKAEKKWETTRFQNVDRKWLLDTYAECLYAVRGHRSY